MVSFALRSQSRSLCSRIGLSSRDTPSNSWLVRVDEWAEFEADCGKFEAEIDREIAKAKFTFGELEEEEQSLDRLRRWFRDLKKRDVLALPEAIAAEEHLRRCASVLDGYAEQVYQIMHESTPAIGSPSEPAGTGTAP